MFIVGWIAVENVGLARFLPAPASKVTSNAATDAWPTAGGSPSRHGAAVTSAKIRGDLAWQVDLGAPPAGAPIIVDGIVFVGSTDGRMHGLSLSDGAHVWVSDLGAPLSSTASLAGEIVFAGLLDGRVVAMDAATGDTVWEFKTGQPVRSSPAVLDGVLYVGSSDHRLYALDASTGDERWSFATGGRITSDPSVNEHLVIVTAQDNYVHFVDHKTAKRKFDYEISLTTGSASLAGDSVFVADVDGTIRRIHSDERVLPFEKAIRTVRRWMFRWGMADELPRQKGAVWVTQDSRESFVGTPAVDETLVYVGTAGGKLLAFDREAGAERWRTELASLPLTSPTVVGGQVLVGDASGHVSSIDRLTGDLSWQKALSGAIVEGVAAADAMSVVATDAGAIYAFR